MANTEAIMTLIKKALFDSEDVQDVLITEDELNEMIQQSIEAIPSDLINSIIISDSDKKRWATRILLNITNYKRVMKEQQKMTDLLMCHGIKPVILKGISAGMYYPRPELRCMGDVDFIVHNSQFDEANRILHENGYEYADGFNPRHLTYNKGGVRFELHHHFSNGTNDEKAVFLDNQIEKAINLAELHCNGKFTWYSFDTCTNGLILIQHIRQHLYSGLGLRQIIDWMMYVNYCIDDEIWSKLEAMIEKSGNIEIAKTVTRMCEIYFGLPNIYNWTRDADEEKCKTLFKFILIKGNMGRKKSDSSSRVISALNAGGKGIIERLKYEQASGMIHWKATRKHKIIRPFAWIYGIGHHISMLQIDNESLMSILKGAKESKRQKKLIDELINNGK